MEERGRRLQRGVWNSRAGEGRRGDPGRTGRAWVSAEPRVRWESWVGLLGVSGSPSPSPSLPPQARPEQIPLVGVGEGRTGLVLHRSGLGVEDAW